jgi:hypothetical protein
VSFVSSIGSNSLWGIGSGYQTAARLWANVFAGVGLRPDRRPPHCETA